MNLHSAPGPDPRPGAAARRGGQGRAGAPRRQRDLPVPCGGRDATHTGDSRRRPCGVTFRALHKRHRRLRAGGHPAPAAPLRPGRVGSGGSLGDTSVVTGNRRALVPWCHYRTVKLILCIQAYLGSPLNFLSGCNIVFHILCCS